MAKCIRRVGIVFFALVLTFLLMAGIFAVKAVEGNGIINANNESIVDNNSDTALIDDEFVPDFTLTGVSNNEVWETAVLTSMLQTEPVKVLMTNDWIAAQNPADSTKTSFGTSEKGFYNGEICVPSGANIILNLNGYTINRNQPIMIAHGAAIVVRGELTIMDSKFNFDEAYKLFNVLPASLKNALKVGKITGGKNQGNSGGIYCATKSKLNVYGGMIYGNYSSANGGGIYGDIDSEINFYNGVVVDNTANVYGGGIGVGAGTLNIHNGIIANNICSTHGAGVSVDALSSTEGSLRACFNFYDGIIGYNYSNNFGGGLAIYGVDAEIHGGQIINNQAATNSAGITVWRSNGASTYLKMYGGLIARNKLDYQGHNSDNGGAGILVGDQSTVEMFGGEISDNVMLSSVNRKMNGSGINVITRGNLILKGGIIKNNIITDLENKISAGAGIAIRDTDCTIQISGNPQIYDNYCNGKASDLYLCSNNKINVQDSLSGHIGVELAEGYGASTFTTGYGAVNGNPSEFFFSNNGAQLATLNGSEVSFEKTVESEIYDYIYFENGKRNNYKDTNLTHAVNDYAKSKQVNGGKLILGNIAPNTSVNSFIQNINFDITKVKLYDSNNKLIYDKGNSVENIDSSLYDKRFELAVGTGWRLETYTDSGVKIEEFTLSVLGDINGDGKISASDVTYLRELANNKELFDSLKNAEVKLASLVINQGKVTSADSEIIINVINQKLTIDLFY